MEIEKLAISAVVTSLSKTDRLTSFLNWGDKEPSWDGNIYIHEDKRHTKKNIKKLDAQVKGKSVKKSFLKNSIKYSVSYDDLHAYMMNGGTVYFVVYIDRETGDPLQIYYTTLLPLKIKSILNVKKTKYQIELTPFPEDNIQKTEIIINFYNNAQKQVSFAGRDLPSIDELAKQGVLESITFHYTGLGKNLSHIDLPKKIDGKPVTIYANIKGGSAPIPVEYYESIHNMTMSGENDLPVTVGDEEFYSNYSIITTASNIEFRIGSCVRIVFPNSNSEDDVLSADVKIKIKGNLRERIKGMEFVSAIIENKHICIGGSMLPVNVSKKELGKIRFREFPDILNGYKRAQCLFDIMHVEKDFDIENCSDKDIKKLNFLIATILDKKYTKDAPENGESVQRISISNITLMVVYLKNHNGGYSVWDYFNNQFCVNSKYENGEWMRVSQFSSLVANDFLEVDNLYLPIIIKDYKSIEPHEWLIGLANSTLLEILTAYDKNGSKELLEVAKQFGEWLGQLNEYLSEEVALLNNLQIILRERTLNFKEKTQLYSLVDSTTDKYIKLGALLLLDEQEEATRILNTMTDDEVNKFKEFPIFKFYRV